jgi:hypothetical protein
MPSSDAYPAGWDSWTQRVYPELLRREMRIESSQDDDGAANCDPTSISTGSGQLCMHDRNPRAAVRSHGQLHSA